MRRVRWAEQARRDFIRITDYFAAKAPDFPNRLLDKIDALVLLIADRPALGPHAEGTTYRKLRIGGTNYILFYKATLHEIVVARVPHAKEDWR